MKRVVYVGRSRDGGAIHYHESMHRNVPLTPHGCDLAGWRGGRLSAIVLVILVLAGCEPHAPGIQLIGATMGTQYSVKLVAPGETEANRLKQAIDTLLAAINATMSTYDPASELSRLNRNPTTTWIEISEELRSVLAVAMAIGRASAGGFDITVGPLVNLWGFGPQRGDRVVPDSAAIERARARVGLDKLTLRAIPAAVRKRRGDVYIDLSGIAKGYAVDQIAQYLEARGVTNYLVDIGGELRAGGLNARGEPWRIGIEDPLVAGREIALSIPLSGKALASSGNYRNYFAVDGVRYGHTIDPHTGWPTRDRLAAVTVIHASAMVADAWSTALMSLGFDAGVKAAAAHGVAALFFYPKGDGWERYATKAFNLARNHGAGATGFANGDPGR